MRQCRCAGQPPRPPLRAELARQCTLIKEARAEGHYFDYRRDLKHATESGGCRNTAMLLSRTKSRRRVSLLGIEMIIRAHYARGDAYNIIAILPKSRAAGMMMGKSILSRAVSMPRFASGLTA